VLRFINLCQSKGDPPPTLAVTTAEMNDAEALWIKGIQHKSFDAELQYLKKSKSSPPLRVAQFGLFIDDNILKCKGRINNSTLSLQSKNPVLLPSNHRFVELIVAQSHHKVQHSGVNDTLVLLRERYWILKGRQAVRKVCRSCVTCKRLQGMCYPSVSSPYARVSEDPPFAHTGVDFAGPLFTSNKEDNLNKTYICLFLAHLLELYTWN